MENEIPQNAQNVYKVALELEERYLNFNHYNKKNPLDELLFIICSTKTNESLYLSTYKSLKRKFPRFIDIASASPDRIAEVIAGGGLSRQKSEMIAQIMSMIIESFGRPTLAPLSKMSTEEGESFLISLPGVGKKTARCVLMYSLSRQVFPVDTHIWRISQRLGWIEPTKRDGSCSQKDMDRLQAIIPEELRYSLHVNMISLGRELCLARNPACALCPITSLCPKIGVVLNSPPTE